MKLKRTKATPGYTGTDLKELRKRRGWSQEELARRLGVSFATVSRWENGHQAPSKMAQAVIDRIDK